MKNFQLEITVPTAVIDAMQHVNNVAYLQWVQDVAEKHWVHSTTKKTRDMYVWVVLHHSISYKAPAFANEILLIETWVSRYEGVTSKRHTAIRRKADNKLLVVAETLWCLIDKNTGKPQRIHEQLQKNFPEVRKD